MEEVKENNGPAIPGGYYIKARAAMKSAISSKPPVVRELWDWLLANAYFKDQKEYGYTTKRGQLITTNYEIIKSLSWFIGFRKEAYSERQMKGAMDVLRTEGMIACTKVRHGTLVTICNYDYYQTPENYEGTYVGTNEGNANGPRREDASTNVSDKNEKKDKNERKKPVRLNIFLESLEEMKGENLYESMPDSFYNSAVRTGLQEEKIFKEWKSFAEYYIDDPDCRKPTKLDWLRTWINWVSNK